MKYSFNFCHGSRTVGFSTSTIFVEARTPPRLFCRYVRPLVVAHGESFSSLAVELGLAASDELVAIGHDVVLFASGDSETAANLEACWPTGESGRHCPSGLIFLPCVDRAPTGE